MKQVFYFAIFFLATVTANAQLWTEDFSAEADGAQSGTAGGTLGGTWSVTVDPSGTFAKGAADAFYVNNTNTEGTWTSNVIDISSVGYAILDIEVITLGFGFSASDYLRFYYRLDGGPEIMFSDVDGTLISVTTQVSAIVAGSTLQLIVKGVDNSFLGIIAFDNVTVTAAPIIYSRKSGIWTDVAGGFGGTGTWSLTGHTGTACGCYPLNSQVAIIGSGHTVTLPASQTTIGTPPTTNLAPGAVDVYGTLQYNTSTVTLGVQQGLFRVRSGGAVNSSSGAITGEQVSFLADVGGATFQVDAGGTASIEDLVIETGATNFHYLSGGGSLTITDDILINADGGSLTNNRTASFTVGDDLDFNAANSGFTNNGTMTISDDVTVDANNVIVANSSSSNLTITDDLNFSGTNSIFSNNGTSTVGDILATAATDDDNVITNGTGATLNVGSFTPTDADMDVLNSGTINQSGNFTGINTADTNFDNLSNATWNWSLTPNTTFDTDIATVLNLTASGNTFNYNGAGAQRIIPTTHHHITLSNSGAKESNNASFAVQGNWTVSGTATFTEGTGTITLNGSVAQSITNTAGETFYNLTINNSFGASPQITLNDGVSVLATLTMSDGNVNLNGNNFTIGTSAASTGTLSHAGASTNGWMYGGNLIRYMSTAATTIGTADQNEGFFPLGSASDWRPFYVGKSNTANSGGRITVSHTNSTSTSDVNIADTNPAATIRRRHDSFWTVSTSGISAGTWALRAGGTNFGTIGNVSHLRMSTSSGVVATNSAGTNTTADPRVNRTGLTVAQLANNFHLASTNAASSPLPIELLAFTALLNNSEVNLRWSTAAETNNDYFTVERASDIEHFEPLLEIDGKGTTKELNDYAVTDPSPMYGRSYYRLKQTDFDGKFSYSSVQVVNYEGPQFATLSAYPSPLKSGSKLTIKIEGLRETTRVPVQILNIQGQKLYDKVLEVRTPGTITEEISADNFLTSGLYIIKAGETIYLTKKIVVE
ncbi:hypothetical protein [Chryseolinea sp. H1M3-3]|uniref:hypothetical protein n=1 Tax=Chryseolinea sp. H1M3-3 TaxID=3034144 RepID=UPI0023EAA138|nr:hypothetical protein [Chryseolinea sp. H1M3-3]